MELNFRNCTVVVFSFVSLLIVIKQASAQMCVLGCDDFNACTVDACVSSTGVAAALAPTHQDPPVLTADQLQKMQHVM